MEGMGFVGIKVNCRGWWFLDFNGIYFVYSQKLDLFIVFDVKTLEVWRLVGRIRRLMGFGDGYLQIKILQGVIILLFSFLRLFQ